MELEKNDATPEVGVAKEQAKKLTMPKRKARKKLSKKARVWIIIGSVAVVLAAILIVPGLIAAQAPVMVALADTTVLGYSDIQNLISATGRVESNNSHHVYSTQSYNVKNINVKVGDVVKQGDVLCELDTTVLEEQIEKKELAMNISAETAAQQVKSARDSYNAARETLEEGLNASMISAETSVRSAYEAWQKAQKNYDEYVTNLRLGQDSTLLSQQNAVNNAASAISNAQAAYDASKKAYDAAYAALNNSNNVALAQSALTARESELTGAQGLFTIAETTRNNARDDLAIKEAAYHAAPNDATKAQEYYAAQTTLAQAEADLTTANNNVAQATAARDAAQAALARAQSQSADTSAYDLAKADFDAKSMALSNAQTSYNSAVAQLNAATRDKDSKLYDYSQAIESAYQSYQTALRSYESTEAGVDSQLESTRNTLKSTELSAGDDMAVYELAKMQEDLEETRITAPASGTITAVYAKIGSSGTGLLFMIEDTKDLIIKSSVKEYDIGTVSVGMPVTIKSDATGDEVYDGAISNIAPTSNKNTSGSTETTGDVLFATDVSVTSKQNALRIGMNVRLNYIIESQQNVLYVPYDAVYTNAMGASCVMVAEEQADGTVLLCEYEVTTGMENDLNVVITGEKIAEGVRVINQPNSYMHLLGQTVMLSEYGVAGLGAGADMISFGF